MRAITRYPTPLPMPFPDGFPARSLVQSELHGGAAAKIEVQAWRTD